MWLNVAAAMAVSIRLESDLILPQLNTRAATNISAAIGTPCSLYISSIKAGMISVACQMVLFHKSIVFGMLFDLKT